MIKELYNALYNRSPVLVKSALTKAVFQLLNKPFVKECSIPENRRFPKPYKGCMVVSADFEMAWAWRYSKSGKDSEKMGLRERRNIPFLLRLFQEFNIPITWATVGHLFLDHCSKKNGRPHANLARIPHFDYHWMFAEGDWYDHDPCSSVEKSPAWYGADLIEMIINSEPKHEIGCHSYSHLNCNETYCPPQVFEDEISECVSLAKNLGIHLKSMVFPGGTNGNYAILKKYSFTNYRYNDDRWDLFYPEKDALGLWRIPSSTSLGADSFDWNLDYQLKRYKTYVDKAISERSVFHIWFHPSLDDFSMKEVLPRLLEYACERREEKELWCTTMMGLSEFCENAMCQDGDPKSE